MSCTFTLPNLNDTTVLTWDGCQDCTINNEPAICMDNTGPFYFLTNLTMSYASKGTSVGAG